MRVLSGVQPSGDMHLGGYLGAFRHWVDGQHDNDGYYCVVDLHALTVEHDHQGLSKRTMEVAQVLLSVGIDPEVSTLFVQSHVHEHAELSWLLECTARMGELRRMTQFKDKQARRGEADSARVGLFTYPCLMAADILLYGADRVPVGEDQRQHLELARDLAIRFNHRYGETFVVPTAAVAQVGARIMDLQDPTRKMSKSADSPLGTLRVLDEPAVIERKIARAVTDTETEVRFDPEAKPGVSNLLEILAAATGRSPDEAARGHNRYGPLKAEVSAAVIEMLAPIRERHAELEADPGAVAKILEAGAQKASATAGPMLERAKRAIGLLERRDPP